MNTTAALQPDDEEFKTLTLTVDGLAVSKEVAISKAVYDVWSLIEEHGDAHQFGWVMGVCMAEALGPDMVNARIGLVDETYREDARSDRICVSSRSGVLSAKANGGPWLEILSKEIEAQGLPAVHARLFGGVGRAILAVSCYDDAKRAFGIKPIDRKQLEATRKIHELKGVVPDVLERTHWFFNLEFVKEHGREYMPAWWEKKSASRAR